MKSFKELISNTSIITKIVESKVTKKIDNEDKLSVINENEYEDVLIKNHIKIKSKFETKFGTEFKLAKKYNNDDIQKILKNYKVSFDGDSIFVSK